LPFAVPRLTEPVPIIDFEAKSLGVTDPLGISLALWPPTSAATEVLFYPPMMYEVLYKSLFWGTFYRMFVWISVLVTSYFLSMGTSFCFFIGLST
jgi:hypothetical protein